MIFNRYALSRTALGLCSAMLFLSVPQARAQKSGQQMSSSIINFSSREELRAADAAGILGNRLQVRSGLDELRSAYIEKPGDGMQVQRFHQYFRGLRVSHGSYTLTSKNGSASYAFGKYYAVPADIAIVPALSEPQALAAALKIVDARKYAWESNPAEYPKGELQLVEDFRSAEEPNGEVHLAWVFDVEAEVPLVGSKMYIDAQTGKLLLSDAIIKHAAATGASLYSGTLSFEATATGTGSYVLTDATRGNGISTYDMNQGTSYNSAVLQSSTSTVFGQDAAVDAHWGASRVYDYWKNTHNRLSYDGADAVLRSYVHYSTNYNNAFWSGNRMVYGDGTAPAAGGLTPLTSLDVCAHEIGHGICQFTAALVYRRESGALNEGFSDIWGAVIENYANPLESDARAKDIWLIGEELGNTFRSMRNPKQYAQPSTYQGTNWWNANAVTCDDLNDQCGVHYNSGVLNHWFYLLSDGGSGTNDLNDFFKVAGIGITDAAKIAYATELALNSTANYASCRTASIAAATVLFGSCSKQVESVTRAWYAVGVGPDYNAPCAPQIAFESGVITRISENVSVDGCKPSKLITVPVLLRGSNPLGGDSATVTATVVGGNAIAGVDYDLTASGGSFRVGGATAVNVGITVYDNGYSNIDKYIDLKLTLNARGSNASLSIIGDSTRVFITENEKMPDLGGEEPHQILTANTSNTTATPFYGASMGARNQYIYRPFELAAAGLRPNVPVTSLEYYVNGQFTSQAYTNYTVKMANSAVGTLNNGFLNLSFTQVFSANVSTVFGWNKLQFTTPFIWNGTDNIVVEVCFANSAAAGGSNDRVTVSNGPQFLAAYSSSNSSGGCSLPFVIANLIGQRPVMLLNQDVPGAAIETALDATRTWDVPSGKQVYFTSIANEKLMVSVAANEDSLGCVTAKVSATGNGLEYSKFAHALNRTRKEYTLSGSLQPGVPFTGVFYFTDAELGGADLSKVKILYTTEANDWNIRSTNSRVLPIDDVIPGVGYKGFVTTINAYGRYFLIDNALTLNVPDATQENSLWTGANPFTDFPVLHSNLSRSEQVNIRLLDVTGKVVYTNDTRLDAGSSRIELRGPAALAPGTYVLQVIRPNGVFTRQLVKN